MELQHAAMGRRKLEEIRQKKLQEKSYISSNDSVGTNTYLDDTLKRSQQQEVDSLLAERRDLEMQLNDALSQLSTLSDELKKSQSESSLKDTTISELKQILQNITMERDAAITFKEDILTQLRVARRRIQEAEEEQYKAEEDAAALRLELKNLQHKEEPSDTFRSVDHDMSSELQNALRDLKLEQQQLTTERQQVAKILAEKKDLEIALSNARAVTVMPSASLPIQKGTSESLEAVSVIEKLKLEKIKYERQLRELASMVERLESGRQKLLAEVDAQSVEIERLFAENADITTDLAETRHISAKWELQAQECLKQNTELRRRLSQARMGTPASSLVTEGGGSEDNVVELIRLKDENSNLRHEVEGSLREIEELNMRTSQLSIELSQATHSLDSVNRMYKPILLSIETQLLQIKENT